MAKDPVCGMEVDENKAIHAKQDGRDYYFCSANCKDKFVGQNKENSRHGHTSHHGGEHSKKEENVQPASKGTIYTCPMHPEIEQDHPGDCPKCGMALEPKTVSSEDSADQESVLKFV